MREILFRGKRIDNGEWVEGFYFCMVHDDGRHVHHFIMPLGADLNLGTPIEKIQVEIDVKTICQFTGLLDKNGNKIWENDIIRHYNKSWEPNVYTEGIIKWNAFKCRFENQSTKNPCYTYAINAMYNYEVFGNIFDNADLVKE